MAQVKLGQQMVRRLGDLLVAEGLITEAHLRQALSDQKGKTDKLGTVLVGLGFITEEQLIGFLSRQYGIPSITLGNLDIDAETLRLVPPHIAKKYEVLPVKRIGGTLTLAMSDPTNVFALEIASRMRKAPGPYHFATSQRVVRAQPVPKLPGFSQHFRIFALASGGMQTVQHGFTVETLVAHIRTLQAALDRLEQHGYAFGKRRVDILATPERGEVGDRIATIIGGERKLLEHAYYSGGLRYMLWVTAPDGTEIPLGDGGAFDWLAKLASNRRAVFVASGLGAQLVAVRFRSL